MGKIRAKTLGDKEQEQKEQQDAEARRLAKIEAAKAEGQARVTEERKKKEEESPVIANEAKQSKPKEVKEDAGQASMTEEKTEEKKKGKKVSKYAAKKGAQRQRSEKYQAALQLIDKSKHYSLKDALQLLEKAHLASFDETVELHINTASAGLSGQVTLPHGTGKKIRIAILQPLKDAKAADDLLKEIESGKITFDILIATPDAMPKLARVAKVLGPKGLMPNPKAGTVSAHPEVVVKQYEGGQMYFKTESKMPVMHVAVGKLSFGAEKLAQNVEAFLKGVKMENIKKVTIKSTMSPGIRLLVK